MSKERARRREAREREVAVRAAERAAQKAAQQRRRARRDALLAPVVTPFRRLRLALTTGRQSGALAERRRKRTTLLIAALLFLQVLVWIIRPDWEARLAAALVALLAFPVVAALVL
ncbi:hypothetical protein [Marmoricola sp. RAF53]|uniref:hypothetical protein n=1 Tax=Marmoricola sp. RAF53 TaxID=3233059 RepID=UPI003F99CB8C